MGAHADVATGTNYPLPPTIGYWRATPGTVSFAPLGQEDIAQTLRRPVAIVLDAGRHAVGLALDGVPLAQLAAGEEGYSLLSSLGPMYPEWLGSRAFTQTHGLRFAYLGGSMARGIATAEMAIALANVGAMGMFGAAGLAPHKVEAAIDALSAALDARGLPWGCNLIHSPNEPALEEAIVDLYLRRGVRRVEASAFIRLTKAVVRYACTGLWRDAEGRVQRVNHVFAKVSREEVARQFLSPPPAAMLQQLQEEGALTAEEAALAATLPVAEQLIVEADSGGHTDNRPLPALFPVIARLRDDLVAQHGYPRPVFLGAAGGLGTPEAVAAGFALGAAFVVIGSVHQSCVESGLSAEGRRMLSQAGPADVAMTASADMFEMGVKVQVLSRGTLMAVRGNQLFELYRRHASLDDIPADVRAGLEKNIFRMPLEAVWQETLAYFSRADPAQLERAAREPKHRLALVLRWYIGHSSRWPIVGEADRQVDYQIWCGPAMGAFNRWVAGSFLESSEGRGVQQVALNLLEGAAHVTRAHQYRTFGLALAAHAFSCKPAQLRAA
jgi:trans-AT polyketide synthase/acyltransferase/oxidoreductase domain-containing protein